MRLTARKFPYDGITQQVQRVTGGISPYLSRVPPAPLMELCGIFAYRCTISNRKMQVLPEKFSPYQSLTHQV